MRAPAYLRTLGWIALALSGAFLAVFLILPLGMTITQGLRPSALIAALAHPLYRQGLLNSAAIACITTLLSTLLAVPVALVMARYRFRGRALMEALLLSPLILPPFVGALGVAQLFGQFGAVNAALAALGAVEPGGGPDWLYAHRFALVCALEALHLYPIIYLNTATSLSHLDHSLVEAAQMLGAGRWTVLSRVVLPLITPGLFGGGIVVLVWSFTELGTPLMLGYDRATPVQIFSGLNELSANPVPFALVAIMLAIASALYLIARRVFLRRHQTLLAKSSVRLSPTLLRGWQALSALSLPALVVVLAILPHIAVVLIAFSQVWYATIMPTGATLAHLADALAHPAVVPGVVNSLRYAAGATVLCLLLGAFLAWVVVRWRPVGWQAFDVLAMLPLAVPGVVMAFGFFIFCQALRIYHLDALYAVLDPVGDPTLLLIIAYAIRRLPHVVRASAAGLAQVPHAYEEAAASLGAGMAYRLRRITLPLISGSLLAGGLLAFCYSMLEVSDSLILAQKQEYFPITKVLFELVTILGPGPSMACALALWAMLFLASILWLASAALGKGASAMFSD
jgi:iron(III) transport system permease protein